MKLQQRSVEIIVKEKVMTKSDHEYSAMSSSPVHRRRRLPENLLGNLQKVRSSNQLQGKDTLKEIVCNCINKE